MGDGSVNLPPGFRFCPTDEELVLHFLYCKASHLPCHPNIIPDLDLPLRDPWELNGKALSTGNQYYYFAKVKENRVTENGYWKELDIIEPINASADKKVGMKNYLVFNIGESPTGVETSWVMQEYHLCSSVFNRASHKSRRKRNLDYNKWVLCRVYERNGNSGESNTFSCGDGDDSGTELSLLDEILVSLDDDFDEISLPN
ncbi:NAC domain protein [Quillaja saponaria]|uniref:NAC domain protein n=1 Tax=Quillaja saponaria TaxID=32244 RepID=A0AAD7KSH5_QUISA|nr:NAC domain protein [Quillaja saponaria]